MSDNMNTSSNWFEKDYTERGFNAQRLYPNEELLKFFGRNYFALKKEERGAIKVVEVGCGSCSNLWMIAREGYQAYGIDLSEKSLDLGKSMLDHWKVSADLRLGSMHELPYSDSSMDVLFDIVSSYCLPSETFILFIKELNRVLKKGGKFFIYTPSVESDDYKKFEPAVKIDEFTLNGIYRKESAFYGNFYPFRFESVEHLRKILSANGFKIDYCETTTRSTKSMTEVFQYISLEATKI